MTTGTILDYLAHGPAETADANTAAFKAGVEAEHAQGIRYQGPWEIFGDGFSEHTRRSARALAATGLPVHLRSLNQDNLKADTPEMVPVELLLRPMLRASIKQYVAEIYQVVPQDALLQFLTTHQHYSPSEMRVLNAHRAVYTVWERDRISDAARTALNRVGQAWVGCSAHAKMLAENGVDAGRLRVVPCPYFPDDPHLKLRGRVRQKGVPRFYHIGKWEPRKAQDRIVVAFLRAFHPGEAQLYLKVSPFATTAKIEGFQMDPMGAIHDALADAEVGRMGWTLADVKRCLFVITKRLPAAELVRLHAIGDIYVSMSRGEGFDMPALDAKLAGNGLVYTPSGGTQSLADPERDWLVQGSGRVPCHPFYRWNEDACYLSYNVEAAVEQMRAAAKYVANGNPIVPRDMSWCSAEVVGREMKGYVDELLVEGHRIAVAYGEALKRAEAEATGPAAVPDEVPAEILIGPRTFIATHGASPNAPYGGARVNAMLLDLLGRHPLLGPIEVAQHDYVPDVPPDIAFVEVPTGSPYLRRLKAKRIVLLRYGDQGHGACAYETFEAGADAVVVVPTEYAYRTLGYRIPYRVVFNAFEAPDRVRSGGERGKKVLYAGAYRFVKDTPLAARVAALAPDLQFVWRRSTDLHESLAPLEVPSNVEVLDPTADRAELWRDIGCVLVTSRYESFCLIAYEAACRGIPVVFHAELGSIMEWTGFVKATVPGAVYPCATAAVFAGACRDAVQRVAEEGYDGRLLMAIADEAHRKSLLQLDQLVRSLANGFC